MAMPINLNQVLRGVGNTDDLIADGNLVFTLGKNVVHPVEGATATGTIPEDAASVTAALVNITAGGSNTGIIYPTFPAGHVRMVYNATATAKKVYPPSGGRVNGYTANEAFTLNSGLGVLFAAMSTSNLAATFIS